MKRFLLVLHMAIAVLCLCFNARAQTQVVMNGAPTKPVTLPGSCVYNWTNSNPTIGLPASGTGNIPSFTAINTGTAISYGTITAAPDNAPLAYLPDILTNSIIIFNTNTNAVVKKIYLGNKANLSGGGLAISPDFTKVYVTAGKLYIISTVSQTLVDSINIPQPGAGAATLDGKFVYTASTLGNAGLGVVNTATRRLTQVLIHFPPPADAVINTNDVVVSADNTVAYVSVSVTDTVKLSGIRPQGYIAVFNALTGNFTSQIYIGPKSPNGVSPGGMLLSADGNKLYVAANKIFIINTITNVVTDSINVDARNLAFSPDSSKLYATSLSTFSAINLANKAVIKTINFSKNAWGISVSKDGSKLYVPNMLSTNITEIDAATYTPVDYDMGGRVIGTSFHNFIVPSASDCSPTTINYVITPSPATPTILVSGTPGILTTNAGTASASTSFSVSGFKLSAGILVSPPAGFEVSTDNVTFSPTVTIGTGGDIPATTVYVRLPAADAVGNYSGNIVLSAGAVTQNVAVSGSVSPVGSVVPNQIVYNGQLTQQVTLPGTSCVDQWSADKAIGLKTGIGVKIPAFKAVNLGTTPITATITVDQAPEPYPWSVVWVLNQLTGKVFMFHAESQVTALGAFSVGAQPYAMAIDKARTRVYITNKTTGTVSVGDIEYVLPANAGPVLGVTVSSNIQVGKSPEGIAVSPDGSTLYVANSADGTVSVINTTGAVPKVTATIPLAMLGPAGLAISPDGSKIYVANGGSGTVSVISTATNTITGIITVGSSPQNIVLSPDGSKLYVTNQGSNSVSVINTSNNSVTPDNVGNQPFGIAISPDGSRVYVSNSGANTVSVINTSGNGVVATINVGTSPTGLTLSPDGAFLYVTNSVSGDVTVINTATNIVDHSFPGDNLGGNAPVADLVTGPIGCAIPLTYTITVLPTPPTISATGYLAPLTTSAGVASATTSFVVSGQSLTAGITVTPPTGFEVSADGVTFSPQIIVGKAGNIDSTKVYVRLPDTDQPNSYSGDIVLSSSLATNVTEPTAPSTVTAPSPAIIAGTVSGKIASCAGTPSASPAIQQFSVKVVALKGVLTAVAPAGFEVSIDPNQGFAASVDITNLDASGKSIVYVRSSATASGSILGDVKIGSPGAEAQYAHVYGVAYLIPTGNPVPSQTLANGKITKAITFSGTGSNAFGWGNDTPGIGLATSGVGDIAPFIAVNTGSTPIVAHITAMPLNTMLAYTANQASNDVTVINVATNQIIATIPVGSSPQGIWINADGTRIYVTDNSLNSQNTNSITVINTGNNKVIATVPVGNVPAGLRFSPDGSQIYVYNAGVGVAPIHTITTIDAATNNVLSNDYGNFIPRHGPVVNPKTGYMYVPNYGGGNVSVIDTASNKTIVIIPTGADPTGATITPDGNTVYVTNGQDNNIAVINTATNKVTGYLQTDHFPADIVITPGSGCAGSPVNFTITVNPPVPTINASGDLDALTTVYSTPSPPTTFMVSGTYLTEQILVSPPSGFEVSIDGLNFGPTVTIGNGGDVPPTTVYVRLGAATPVGTYNGNITLSSLDATDVTEPTAPVNTVLPPLQTIFVSAVTGSISSCQGLPSASPFVQQFKVTGKLLTGTLTVSAPVNFEVSIDPAGGFTNTITLIPAGGSVGPQVIYVRSSASALGNIVGSVALKSAGAVTLFATVKGNVTITPTVKPVNNLVVANGALTSAINFTGTGNTYNWINKTPGIGLAPSGGGNIAPFIAVNTTSSPITAQVTVTPVSASLAYIANSGGNTVTVVNTQTNQVVNTIPVGKTPFATVVSPDGSFVYVANQGSGTVSKINTVTSQVTGIPVGDSPDGIAISPDGALVFVANENGSSISVISTVSNGVFTTIQVGKNPKGLIVSPDGSRLYVTNRNEKSNNVYAIDLSTSTYTVIAKIATGQSSPEGAIISPDGATLYVSNYTSNTVSVINTATLTLTANITVGVNPVGLAISPDGKILYVGNTNSSSVSVINTATNTLIGTGIKVGNGPQGVSVSPDGTLLCVANAISNSITIINTATNAVVATLPAGGTPVSTGNFISSGMGCAGIPATFTITVNPTLASSITATGNLTGLTTTYGTPSIAGTFNVTGTGLTKGISVTPPAGFELSTDNIQFGNTITLGGPGNIGPLPAYVRLAAVTGAGTYAGNIKLTSPGIADAILAMPNSTVNTTPLTIKADDKLQLLGAALPVFTATYNGFVNKEGPSVLVTPPLFTTTAVASSPLGQYPITVSGAASPNYSFVYVPGVLTIANTAAPTSPVAGTLSIPNIFTPNGDGINDTWNIASLGGYTDFSVEIFNRLGQNVFYSKNHAVAWDGTYKGVNLPTGTYYYIINITGLKPTAGSITIIR